MSKYNEALENRIREFAKENGGVMNLDLANKLAEEAAFVKAEISGRSIVAKVRVMGLEYQPVQRKSKDGSAIASKSDIAEQIEKAVGFEIPGLSGAQKVGLKRLLDWVQETAEVDAA